LYLGGRQFVIPVSELFRKLEAQDGGKDLCMLEIQPNDMAPQNLEGAIGSLLPGLLNPGRSPISQPSLPTRADKHDANQHSSAQQGPPPGFPPFFGGMNGALPMKIPNVRPGQEVEQIINKLPNGSICTTTVTEDLPTPETKEVHKKVKKSCVDPHQTSNQRKLQGQASPLPMPIMPLPMAVPLEEAPGAKLFVLGGVFMEKFVTIFDYDTKKVGFGEAVSKLSNAAIQEFSVSYDVASHARAQDTLSKQGMALSPNSDHETKSQMPFAATSAPAAAPFIPPSTTLPLKQQLDADNTKGQGSNLGMVAMIVIPACGVCLVLTMLFGSKQLPWNRRRDDREYPRNFSDDIEPGE
jgi:hypothetical protein